MSPSTCEVLEKVRKNSSVSPENCMSHQASTKKTRESYLRDMYQHVSWRTPTRPPLMCEWWPNVGNYCWIGIAFIFSKQVIYLIARKFYQHKRFLVATNVAFLISIAAIKINDLTMVAMGENLNLNQEQISSFQSTGFLLFPTMAHKRYNNLLGNCLQKCQLCMYVLYTSP